MKYISIIVAIVGTISYGYTAMSSIPKVDFDKSIQKRIMKDCKSISDSNRATRMLAYAY